MFVIQLVGPTALPPGTLNLSENHVQGKWERLPCVSTSLRGAKVIGQVYGPVS